MSEYFSRNLFLLPHNPSRCHDNLPYYSVSSSPPYPGDTTTPAYQPYIENNKQVTALIDSDTHFQLVVISRYPPSTYRMYRADARFAEMNSNSYSAIYYSYKNELDVTIFDTNHEGTTSYILQMDVNGRTYDVNFTVTKTGSTSKRF